MVQEGSHCESLWIIGIMNGIMNDYEWLPFSKLT